MSDIRISDIFAELENDLQGCIARVEEDYRAAVTDVAEDVLSSATRRIILLAGPSSSGKTTTARLLSEHFDAVGHPARVISLDDFYRDMTDPAYPQNADGKPDPEAPDALHLAEVRDCLSAVLAGERTVIPRYDFKTAARLPKGEELLLPAGGVLIVEGLHALNPRLTEGLPPEGLYRLFISLSTNLVTDEGERILSGRKMRFLRRMCRDALYRGASAARTYAMWRGVLAGEDAYLYPYRDTADTSLNTFHRYEVGLFAASAKALLTAEGAPHTDYTETVLAAVARFAPLPHTVVPKTSLLREFLPGREY